MQVKTMVLFLVCMTSATNSAPVNENANINKSVQQTTKPYHKYADILSSAADYIQKLRDQGIIKSNTILDEEQKKSFKDNFNELELLQLIPTIIEQLKAELVAVNDQQTLQKLYGSLWHLIVEEAQRLQREKASATSLSKNIPRMNPVLKAILQAQMCLHRRHYTNDISFNTVNRLLKTDKEKFAIKLVHWWNEENRDVEPSQRILKVAALLIRKHLLMQQKRWHRKHNSKLVQPASGTLKIKSQNGKLPQLSRNKRNVLSEVEDLSKEEMQKLSELIGVQNDKNDDDLDNNIQNIASPRASASNTHFPDYAFDVTATADDGDNLLRRMYSAPNVDQDDGSVAELIKLAVGHNRRRQRNSGYLTSHRDIFSGFQSDSIIDIDNDDNDDYYNK